MHIVASARPVPEHAPSALRATKDVVPLTGKTAQTSTLAEEAASRSLINGLDQRRQRLFPGRVLLRDNEGLRLPRLVDTAGR
jgi:hypothetical protein